MTIISAETLAAFKAVHRHLVVQGVIDFVEDECPGVLARLSPEERLQAAQAGMERAAAWGIPRDHGAAVLFAALRLLAHPHFDSHPACRQILQNTDLPPEARVFALVDRAAGVPWKTIADLNRATPRQTA